MELSNVAHHLTTAVLESTVAQNKPLADHYQQHMRECLDCRQFLEEFLNDLALESSRRKTKDRPTKPQS